MNASINRRITVAEYLVQRGLPADWRYGSPLGRVAAEIYRQTYRREPGKAFRWINGHVRTVMTYQPSEAHILTAAWDRYGCTAGRRPAPVVRTSRPTTEWAASGDSMRWTPSRGSLRSHP